MKNSIESNQMSNGEWKITVKADLPYFQYLDYKKSVEELMEENGFPILRLVGVDQ